MFPIKSLPELFKRLVQAFVLSLREVRDILLPDDKKDVPEKEKEEEYDKNT